MKQEKFATFEEFWPFYVREHSKKSTRTLHFIGTTAAVSLAITGLVLRKRWLLLVAPVMGYGPAWISHFFIEKNKPATFKHPLWSLKADFVMWKKIAMGQMDEEVRHVMEEYERQKSEHEANVSVSVSNAPPHVAVTDEPQSPETVN